MAATPKKLSKAEKDAAALEEKIADMASPDREIAARLHEVVMTAAPELAPRLWYQQPAWAKDGKVLCFFRSGHDDGERYSSFGFSEHANLDDDSGMWPTAFALTELNDATEQQIAKLVEQAVTSR